MDLRILFLPIVVLGCCTSTWLPQGHGDFTYGPSSTWSGYKGLVLTLPPPQRTENPNAPLSTLIQQDFIEAGADGRPQAHGLVCDGRLPPPASCRLLSRGDAAALHAERFLETGGRPPGMSKKRFRTLNTLSREARRHR